jgi:hypothetical protein
MHQMVYCRVRIEHIMRNVLMALLEQPDATLHQVLRIFSDKEFRLRVGKSLRNEIVRSFLVHEFDQFSFGYRADGTAPIQNKVGAFLADPLLNRILTAPEKDLRALRQIGQACMPLRRSILASVAGEKPGRPQLVGIAEVLRLPARQRDSHALASSVIVGSLPGRGRSSSAASGPSATARSTQRWTV